MSKLNKPTRLQFTEEERADPTLEKPIAKSEKASKKADKAQSKIPKKTIKRKERTFDEATGKSKVCLCFEEVDKPKPPSKLEHSIKNAPIRALSSSIHKEISKNEKDNVGLEAAHATEKAGEFVIKRVQSAYHSHKLKPYRKSAIAEKKSFNADVNYLYKKSLKDNPKAASNPVSKWQQKQAIKKQYRMARSGKGASTANITQKTATTTKIAIKKGADTVTKAVTAMVKNPKVILVILALFLLIGTRSRKS